MFLQNYIMETQISITRSPVCGLSNTHYQPFRKHEVSWAGYRKFFFQNTFDFRIWKTELVKDNLSSVALQFRKYWVLFWPSADNTKVWFKILTRARTVLFFMILLIIILPSIELKKSLSFKILVSRLLRRHFSLFLKSVDAHFPLRSSIRFVRMWKCWTAPSNESKDQCYGPKWTRMGFWKITEWKTGLNLVNLHIFLYEQFVMINLPYRWLFKWFWITKY